MSFGVFLCPRYRPAKATPPANAAHSVTAVQSVDLFDTSSVSGQTLQLDNYNITLAGPHHALTISSQELAEGGLLIYQVADLINLPDSLIDQSDNILAKIILPKHFCFTYSHEMCVDLSAHNICCETVLSHCTQWAWEASVDLEVMFESPSNSTFAQCDTTLIDTEGAVVLDSSPKVSSALVGDINGSRLLLKDIADRIYLVEWTIVNDPAPSYSLTASCNGDSLVGSTNLVCWVDAISPSG